MNNNNGKRPERWRAAGRQASSLERFLKNKSAVRASSRALQREQWSGTPLSPRISSTGGQIQEARTVLSPRFPTTGQIGRLGQEGKSVSSQPQRMIVTRGGEEAYKSLSPGVVPTLTRREPDNAVAPRVAETRRIVVTSREAAHKGREGDDDALRPPANPSQQIATLREPDVGISAKDSPLRRITIMGESENCELLPNPLPAQEIISVKTERNAFLPSTAPVRHIITHTDATTERTDTAVVVKEASRLQTYLARGNPIARIEEISARSSQGEDDATELQHYLTRVDAPLRQPQDPRREAALQDYYTTARLNPLGLNEGSSDNYLSRVGPYRQGVDPHTPPQKYITVATPVRQMVVTGAPEKEPPRQPAIIPKASLTKAPSSTSRRKRRSTFATVRAAFLGTTASSKKFQGPLDPPISCPLCSAADQAGLPHKPCDHKFAFNVGGKDFHFHDGTLKPGSSDESTTWIFGRVLDPRSQGIRSWNRVFLLSSTWSTAIDPLFLYLLGINKDLSCLYVEQDFAVLVTFLRTSLDLLKVVHMYLQFRLAYLSEESLTLGLHDLVWDARKVVYNYVHFGGAFFLDLYVILPLPQIMLWWVIPDMILAGSKTPKAMEYMLLTSLTQYIPKVVHTVSASRRMEHVTGFVFGTAWWAFMINLTYYFIAAHVAGACWYLLAIQNVQQCVADYCRQAPDACDPKYLGCPNPVSKGHQPLLDLHRVHWAQDPLINANCLIRNDSGDFDFGIYSLAVPLTEQHNVVNRILYPLFWGLMTLSTFGNALQPSSHNLEVAFSIVLVISGLVLFMLLIGNIQVFLHDLVSKKEDMQIRNRDLEWWMERRQLPADVRQRVRRYERQRWAVLRGVDESALVNDLPDGIRRDIKRHLCLDLVRSIPLFEQLDALVLDNICERLEPRIFIKGETVYKEGDPVVRMYFVSRGHFESSYRLSNNGMSLCVLGPGSFCGDELLSWALRRPHIDSFPPSTATLKSLDVTKVFSLEAYNLKYVTDHFRYKFETETLRRAVRFYSPSWRMWGAVTIQMAWRKRKLKFGARHKAGTGEDSTERKDSATVAKEDEERARMYTAMMKNASKPPEERDNPIDTPTKPPPAPQDKPAQESVSPESNDTRMYAAMMPSQKPREHQE